LCDIAGERVSSKADRARMKRGTLRPWDSRRRPARRTSRERPGGDWARGIASLPGPPTHGMRSPSELGTGMAVRTRPTFGFRRTWCACAARHRLPEYDNRLRVSSKRLLGTRPGTIRDDGPRRPRRSRFAGGRVNRNRRTWPCHRDDIPAGSAACPALEPANLALAEAKRSKPESES